MSALPKVWSVRDPQRPADAIYVGRTTKWGNPYAIGCLVQGQGRRRMTREDVIVLYGHWIRLHPELIAAARTELRGKHLVCHCAPRACHADILLELANQ